MWPENSKQRKRSREQVEDEEDHFTTSKTVKHEISQSPSSENSTQSPGRESDQEASNHPKIVLTNGSTFKSDSKSLPVAAGFRSRGEDDAPAGSSPAWESQGEETQILEESDEVDAGSASTIYEEPLTSNEQLFCDELDNTSSRDKPFRFKESSRAFRPNYSGKESSQKQPELDELGNNGQGSSEHTVVLTEQLDTQNTELLSENETFPAAPSSPVSEKSVTNGKRDIVQRGDSEVAGPSTLPVNAPKLKHIESVKNDALKIAELLGRGDVDVLYDRLKTVRDKPNRVERITNQVLEEEETATQQGDTHQVSGRTDENTGAKGSTLTAAEGVGAHVNDKESQLIRKSENTTSECQPGQGEPTETAERDIFLQVQHVLKVKPKADANRVFHLLEVFSDSDDPVKQVLEHLQKSESSQTSKGKTDCRDEVEAKVSKPGKGNEGNSSLQTAKTGAGTSVNSQNSQRGELLKNDLLYKDTQRLRLIFPDKSEEEIYAHLEVYHQRPNRLQLVMDEFLSSNNDSFSPHTSIPVNPSPEIPEADSQDSLPDSQNETDDVLKRFKRDVKMLKSIFPDCDVQYIMKQLQASFQASDRVAHVTAELLNNKDYPKAPVKTPKNKERKRLKQLKFNVVDFLKLFPEPEKVFYDQEKDMDDLYKKHAAAQLYEDFRDWKKQYIDHMLQTHNYHYLPTLRSIQADMVIMDPRMRVHMALDGQNSGPVIWPDEVDEFFYRELLYSKHEDEARRHSRELKAARDARFALLKANKELQECQCCFEEENLPEDMVVCPAGHPFCRDCVVRLVESSIGEGRTSFPCLTGTCTLEYALSLLQDILPTKIFSLVLRKTQEEELRQANIPDLVTCPFCPYATIMPDEHNKLLKCQNPECLKESCRICKELNHIPLRCEEVEKQGEVQMRTFIEKRMAEAMLRTCPNCQRKFYKVEGCNKMTCVCGQSMCYVCRQPINDYSHFENERCNDARMDNLHQREVEAAAREAREEYIRDHPEMADMELKNDPTKDIHRVGRMVQGYDDDRNDGYYDDSSEGSDDDNYYSEEDMDDGYGGYDDFAYVFAYRDLIDHTRFEEEVNGEDYEMEEDDATGEPDDFRSSHGSDTDRVTVGDTDDIDVLNDIIDIDREIDDIIDTDRDVEDIIDIDRDVDDIIDIDNDIDDIIDTDRDVDDIIDTDRDVDDIIDTDRDVDDIIDIDRDVDDIDTDSDVDDITNTDLEVESSDGSRSLDEVILSTSSEDDFLDY